MKLLSFVGAGTLSKTIYCIGDQEYETTVVQEALVSYYKPQSVVLFTTEKARAMNYAEVAGRINCPVREVMVPDGSSEDDLWRTFSIITAEVGEDDEVLIDITHGFRYLPFISFLTVAYLREVKRTRIAGVVYGAFDARQGDRTPVFDLAPFISILDWIGAVRSFVRHVDATEMTRLVREISSRAYSHGEKDGPVLLNGFVSRLDSFTSAVRLARPIEAINIASTIMNTLGDAETEISRYTPVLSPVINQVSGISRFSSLDPDKRKGPDKGYLSSQRALIKFQAEQGLYMQAISLAREWMVTVLVVAAGDGGSWLNRNTRMEGEKTLSGAAMMARGVVPDRTIYADWFSDRPDWMEYTSIWNKISNLRNAIDHCGMGRDTSDQRAKNLEKDILSALKRLERFEKLLSGDS